MRFLRFLIVALIFLSRSRINSSAFFESKRVIRIIRISNNRSISSRRTSRISFSFQGSKALSTNAINFSLSGASSYPFSLYMRFSIKIFSNDVKKYCSSSSLLAISNSHFNSDLVCSTDKRSKSLTVVKIGFLSCTTQQLGDIFTSQSVNAYKASIVLSDELPGANCTSMRASSAVKSSTLRTLILPFCTARMIVSMIFVVVVPNGISVIISVLLSSDFWIFARMRTAPPRSPSL